MFIANALYKLSPTFLIDALFIPFCELSIFLALYKIPA